MRRRLIFDGTDDIARWVGYHLGERTFGMCVALGIAVGDELIAGIVYHDMRGAGIELSVYARNPKWVSRTTLRAMFNYPFNQLGVLRCSMVVDAENDEVRAYCLRLGFKQEGVIRNGFWTSDAIYYGMLREECPWLDMPAALTEGFSYGQQVTSATAAH